MKKIVKFDEISKEELYKLYLKEVKKTELLEAKLYKQGLELAEYVKKLEETNFQLLQRNKMVFGKKRESIKTDDNTFNEAENHASKKKVKDKSDRKEKNTLTREYLEKHYSEEIVLEPEEIKYNKELIKIGEDITFKIESIPARLKIIKIISNKYVDEKEGKIYQIIKDEAYPHSFCTPSFASETIYNKFILGIPYYRQEEYLYNDGLQISRQNLCNYQIKTSEIIRPMYEYLISKLISNQVKILHADETTLQVLDAKKSNCYVWLFNSSYYDNPIFIYLFSKTRSREVAIEFLKDYSGYLISDCYSGYNNIPNVTNSYCLVHARRNFIEILDSLPQELKTKSISQKIVDEIDKMFSLEREYRKNKMIASEIKERRNNGEFKKHLDKVIELMENANPQKRVKVGKSNQLRSSKKRIILRNTK